MRTYLFGGRLGDFIHGLVVPKYIYDTTGERAQIYVSDIGDRFTAGFARTFGELIPVLDMQEYVESVEVWDNRAVDYHIWQFRNHPGLYDKCWTETYFDCFLERMRPEKNYKWLSWPTGKYYDCLIINRGYVLPSSTPEYVKIIKGYDPAKVFFATSDAEQWERSGLADCTQLLLLTTLSQVVSAIAGCGQYLGDQSAFTAIACALGVDRVIELNRNTAMYEGELRYHDNVGVFHCGYVPDEMTRI